VHGVVVANVVLFDHAMMSCWWPLLCLRKMGQSDCKEIATLVCFFVQLLKGFTSSKEW
jgi:hypothetical protein